MTGILIISWFNSLHDADLGDVESFAKYAQQPGRHIRLISLPKNVLNADATVLIWEGPATATEAELGDAVVAAMAADKAGQVRP